jgi:C_GCAxxG_C_C family probable redox protein
MQNNQFKTVTAFTEAGEGTKRDLNCAETILYGANEAYGIGLDKKVLRIASGFGGGMGLEKVCGALTGSVMALGLLFTKDRGHESDFVENLNRELFARFEEEMGSTECDCLKEKHRTEAEGCRNVILAAARILDDIVHRETLKRN